MIRDENLEVFLKCILEVLNGTIRDEVQTPHTKSLVDALVSVLGRMVAEAGDARHVAVGQVDSWHGLTKQLNELGITLGGKESSEFITNTSNPLQTVEQATQNIQQGLLEQDNYERLVNGLKQGDAQTKKWLGDTVTMLNDLLQGVEESYYRPQGRKGVASVADNLDLLKAKLNQYLHEKYPSLPSEPIIKFTLIPGGQIKRTVIFQLVENDVIPTRLVLRQDMDMEYTGTTVVDEFVIIKRVFDLGGIPLPEPILIESNADVLGDGGCFMLMTEVQNAEPAGTYFGEDRVHVGHKMGADIGKELAVVLARLHAKTLDETEGASEVVVREQLQKFNEVKATWRQQGKPPFSLGLDLGMAWMEANPLIGSRPYVLCHGDLGSHNMMTQDGKLASLIDWELAKMGDPASDIAQLKMMLLDFVIPWEEFKAIYIAEGGPAGAVDNHAVAYYCVWNYIFHIGMATNLWDNFNKGVRDDAAAAGVSSNSMDRLALYESRALKSAILMVN